VVAFTHRCGIDEAVSGAPSQVATVTLLSDRLSRFHRLDGWTSGYGEGWALYAERLMDELWWIQRRGATSRSPVPRKALRAAASWIDLGLAYGLSAQKISANSGELGDWGTLMAA